MKPYKTSELELAAFLKARGHSLHGAKLDGRFVVFEFEPTAADGVGAYFSGAQLSARELFEAHRALRALIKQIHEHESQQSRTATEINDDRPSYARR